MKSLDPPKWADRFLVWYCNPRFVEEIQGDAHELFYRRVDEQGRRLARLKFVWDVLRFFRWSNIKRSNSKYTSTAMFKNYIKISFRSMVKNWVTASINIFGLALAVGVAITIFMFVDMQLHMDSFHTNRKNIYQLVSHVKTDDGMMTWGDSPLLIGPEMKEGHSVVKEFTRVEYSDANIRYEDQVFNEFISFVDPSYLQVFDFPIKRGSKNSLQKKEHIVISHLMAEKFFGREDPLGKQMTLKFNNGKVQTFIVGGVLDKYPYNSSIHLNCLVPMEHYFDQNKMVNWSDFADATFITLHNDQDPNQLSSLLPGFVEKQNASGSRWDVKNFELIRLEGLSLRNHEIASAISQGGHPAGRIGLGVVAAFLMILACFNYMNIAVSSSTKRLKEIALRKVMGGVKIQIIKQFLTENSLQVVFALILGTVLSYYLIMPGFNYALPISVPFTFSSFPMAVLFFGVLLLLIGLISGAYPAFYISKFQPVSIFRGNKKFGTKNVFSKVLLGFQFFFAISTIVSCFVFTENALYLGNKDWGYNQNGILSIAINGEEQYKGLRDIASSNSKIKSYSGSLGHIGRMDMMTSVDHLEGSMRSLVYRVEPGYLETLNLRLEDGALFDKEKGYDQPSATIVTTSFKEKMGWETAIGQTFTYDSVRRTVIGEISDIQAMGFYDEIQPAFFLVSNPSGYNYFTVKYDPENMLEVDQFLAEKWLDVAPYDPYERIFQEDVFASFMQENKANISIMLFISIVAIILACLGLFGLLSFNIQKRMKEFSVRKVLGASASSIIKIASKQYAWIIGISFLIGAPLGYLGIGQMIQSIYGDPKEPGALPLLVAITVMVITVAITISGQIIKATKVNPSETLRAE